MSTRSLRLMALALLAVALGLGIYGLRFGDAGEPAVAAATPAPTVLVWTFATALPAGTALAPEHLRRVGTLQPRQSDVEDAEPYYGRVLAQAVTEGTHLRVDLLAPERPLLDALANGYRALAIKVDEVTAIGGHLRTGDRVDVLFYTKAGKETGDNSTARRLLSAVEVLAYGPELIGDGEEQQRQERAKSVVLAVPAEQAPDLLLAEHSGRLRLAVVGHGGTAGTPRFPVDDHHATSLRRLLGSDRTAAPAARPAPVELYLGEQRTVVATGTGGG